MNKIHKDSEALIEYIYEQVWEEGEVCQSCPFLEQWTEPYPFDVEPRLQVTKTFRECNADSAHVCPGVARVIEEAMGSIEG